MLRSAVCLTVALAIAASPLTAAAPPPKPVAKAAGDAELAAGIRQVEDGEYDAAILTLDGAARRLALDPTKVAELSQAYLYLGIAFVGKGHESAAKAKFREAVSQIRDLTLSAEKFPPRVIDLFESARAEVSSTVPGEKKASKKLWILGGVGTAALAGALVAARGNGGEGDGSGQSQTTTGTVGAAGLEQSFLNVTATGSGKLTATLNWQNASQQLGINCQESDPPYTDCGGRFNRTTGTSGTYEAQVTNKTYLIVVSNYSGSPEAFTLVVRFP